MGVRSCPVSDPAPGRVPLQFKTDGPGRWGEHRPGPRPIRHIGEEGAVDLHPSCAPRYALGQGMHLVKVALSQETYRLSRSSQTRHAGTTPRIAAEIRGRLLSASGGIRPNEDPVSAR